MENNTLMEGAANHIGAKTYIWTKVVNVINDGSKEVDGFGGIFLNDRVPQGAILQEVKPKFTGTLNLDTVVKIVDQVFAYNNFAFNRFTSLIVP